jgi:hypothetical protein
MQNLKEILSIYKETEKQTFEKSERAEIVKKFVTRLNEERTANGFKKLPASFYAIKMAEAGLKDETDLYWFLRYCEDAQNFSKTWWWSLRA